MKNKVAGFKEKALAFLKGFIAFAIAIVAAYLIFRPYRVEGQASKYKDGQLLFAVPYPIYDLFFDLKKGDMLIFEDNGKNRLKNSSEGTIGISKLVGLPLEKIDPGYFYLYNEMEGYLDKGYYLLSPETQRDAFTITSKQIRRVVVFP